MPTVTIIIVITLFMNDLLFSVYCLIAPTILCMKKNFVLYRFLYFINSICCPYFFSQSVVPIFLPRPVLHCASVSQFHYVSCTDGAFALSYIRPTVPYTFCSLFLHVYLSSLISLMKNKHNNSSSVLTYVVVLGFGSYRYIT
jgi:hypothetical protein